MSIWDVDVQGEGRKGPARVYHWKLFVLTIALSPSPLLPKPLSAPLFPLVSGGKGGKDWRCIVRFAMFVYL